MLWMGVLLMPGVGGLLVPGGVMGQTPVPAPRPRLGVGTELGSMADTPAPVSADAAPALPVPSDMVGAESRLGRALFEGRMDLHGRMITHATDLPPAVVRCGNCHAAPTGPDVPRSLAPRLNHDLLLIPRSRRGGPPTFYDRERFCTLLRRGVDPANVVISVEMPRYSMDDTECRALWRFVTGTSDESTWH